MEKFYIKSATEKQKEYIDIFIKHYPSRNYNKKDSTYYVLLSDGILEVDIDLGTFKVPHYWITVIVSDIKREDLFRVFYLEEDVENYIKKLIKEY